MKPQRSMSCQEFVELATAYLEGSLTETERQRFEGHFRTCTKCRTHLAEIRLVIDAAGHLRETAATVADPARAAVAELFRTHGLHDQGARVQDIPLGISNHSVAPGDHIAYMWESDREFMATVGFIATGVEREEACVIVGREPSNRRVLEGLDDLGLNTSDLRRHDRLVIASPTLSVDDLLRAIDDRVKGAVERGLVGVRILGDLGWGMAGWPPDDELLKLEARVTDGLRRYPCIALCSYDVGRLQARQLRKGGLECHPTILQGGMIRHNDAYVPAETFLAGLGSPGNL